jgi:hypothetical protein
MAIIYYAEFFFPLLSRRSAVDDAKNPGFGSEMKEDKRIDSGRSKEARLVEAARKRYMGMKGTIASAMIGKMPWHTWFPKVDN